MSKDKNKDVGEVDRAFRRQAALTIAGAFVSRHGGLGTEVEREANSQMIWAFADAFVAAENKPFLPAETPVQGQDGECAPPPGPPRPKERPAHPSDEWAVKDGDNYRRGFVSYKEAEWYAAARPGAEIIQVSGPEIPSLPMAPSHST